MKTFFKAIISGVIFWAVMFAVVSIFLEWYNQYEAVKISIAIFSGILAVLFVSYLRVENIKQALIYSFIWLTVGILLDSSVTMRFNNQIFSSVYLWLGYGLMFISPLVYVILMKKKSPWKK